MEILALKVSRISLRTEPPLPKMLPAKAVGMMVRQTTLDMVIFAFVF